VNGWGGGEGVEAGRRLQVVAGGAAGRSRVKPGRTRPARPGGAQQRTKSLAGGRPRRAGLAGQGGGDGTNGLSRVG
jgi:hypothetical protein